MGLSPVVDYCMDKTISENFQHLRRGFSINWSGHHCDVIGCGTAIISDGGMKPHRKVNHLKAEYEFSSQPSFKQLFHKYNT